MQRLNRLVPFLGASLALAACGGGSKGSETTTPVAATEPAPEPAQPAQPEPAQAEPAPPPAPPAPTYLPGKFVWFELRSTDVEKSKAFYTELLGWQAEPQEMGGTKFELVRASGKEVAIISAAQGKAKSHWVPFVSVTDVDASVKTIEEQQGKVVTPATDIPNIGRFAMLTDPNGVEFAVFKSVKSDDPDGPPAAGNFVWAEYLTKNKKQHQTALTFYPATLGYTTSQMQMGEGKSKSTYDMLQYKAPSGQDVPRAGVQAAKPGSLGGQWLPWVTVDDVDAVIANAKKLKGKVPVKAHDIPTVGRAAIVADSTGAAIGLLKPAMPEQPGAQPAPDAAKPEEKPAESGGKTK
jgi:uncharacterized protein